MTLTGWIFMVGLRVFDIGALVVWLVWFFRQRDDEDDEGGGGSGGAGGPDRGNPGRRTSAPGRGTLAAAPRVTISATLAPGPPPRS